MQYVGFDAVGTLKARLQAILYWNRKRRVEEVKKATVPPPEEGG